MWSIGARIAPLQRSSRSMSSSCSTCFSWTGFEPLVVILQGKYFLQALRCAASAPAARCSISGRRSAEISSWSCRTSRSRLTIARGLFHLAVRRQVLQRLRSTALRTGPGRARTTSRLSPHGTAPPARRNRELMVLSKISDPSLFRRPSWCGLIFAQVHITNNGTTLGGNAGVFADLHERRGREAINLAFSQGRS